MKKFEVESLIKESRSHIQDVRNIINENIENLNYRKSNHDLNKLNPKSAQVLCDTLNEDIDETEWNRIHMEAYDHHLEYYNWDFTKIPLCALMEMVADGASAGYRRGGADKCTFEDQFAFYTRKGFDSQLAALLSNEFMRCVEIIKAYG